MALFEIARELGGEVETTEEEKRALALINILNTNPLLRLQHLLLCISDESWSDGSLMGLCFPDVVLKTTEEVASALSAADRLGFEQHVSFVLGSELWRRSAEHLILDHHARELCERNTLHKHLSKLFMRPALSALGLDYDAFCTWLKEHGAILAGGFVLGLLTETDSTSDLDIFIGKQNRELLGEEPHEADLHKVGTDEDEAYDFFVRTIEYDISTLAASQPLKRNLEGIKQRVKAFMGAMPLMVFEADFQALLYNYNFASGFSLDAEFWTPTGRPLQVIGVTIEPERAPQQIDAVAHVLIFDFAFCKCFFNGDTIEVMEPVAVLTRTDLAAHSRGPRSEARKAKYEKRGFRIEFED